ncbi:unnamed protein product, partial [Laminaria digitata]
VLEPCSTGLGGDCFMLYYEASTKKVHALNGSGMAPAALTLERCVADLAHSKTKSGATDPEEEKTPPSILEIPPHHPHAVTVPGAAAGWCDAVSSFGSGKVSLSQLMEPAAVLAEEGFPVSSITAHHWDLCSYQLETGPHGAALLMPNGKAPETGDVFRNPDMAGVLRELGAGGKEAFYGGRIGDAMVEMLRELGGVLTTEDLKARNTC